MAQRKASYPGIAEAEQERSKRCFVEDEEPDFIAGAPNCDKFANWTPERVVVYLNID